MGPGREEVRRQLVAEFGDPVSTSDKGKIVGINEAFWAAYYAKSREKLIFDANERQFYEYDPETGVFLPKTADLIVTQLDRMLLDVARTWDVSRGIDGFRKKRFLDGVLAKLKGQIEV
jgi:hypothetical protein